MSYTSIPDNGRFRRADIDTKGWFRFLTPKYVVPAVLSASFAYVLSTSLVWHPTLVVTNTAPEFALYETCKDSGVAMRKMTQVDFPDGLSGLRGSSVGGGGEAGSSSGSGSGSTGSHVVVGHGATITVKSNVHHQRMEGFGGAFTEAAALNFASLPEKERQRVIDTYFGEQGIGLTMGRIHINSCDFSPLSYTFDDVAGDYELKHFDLGVAHDQETMIPFVKRAKAAIERRGETLKLVASPWSPPAWMKAPVPSTGEPSMTDSASPNGLLPGDRVRQSWASYITKWVQAYANSGVDVWAVTPQNEPEFSAPWEACKWNASGELDFINEFLGPTLKKSFPHMKILAFDHNKDHLLDWTKTVIGGDEGNFVDGMAFHWYSGVSRVMDGAYGYENIAASSAFAPGKLFINTEGCSCPGTSFDPTTSWFRAERLGHDIMYDILNNAHGWIVWNLLVNHAGGPNHLNNNCDAPLVTTENSDGFTEQPQLHYLAAFSKFVPPGSRRVLTEVRGDFGFAAVDPSIQPGLELGMYPCESSARQQFFLNGTNPSLATPISVNPDPQGEQGPTFRLCVAPGQGGDFRDYVRLIECDVDVGPFVKPRAVVVGTNHQDDDDGDDDNAPAHAAAHVVNIVDETTGKCLSIADGQTGIGALMLMEKCGTDEKAEVRQLFRWTSNGELVAHALYAANFCVTSGSPLLSAVAFRDPSEQTVVVLMNEADAATRITVKDDAGAEIFFTSPAHSIQSLVFSHTDV